MTDPLHRAVDAATYGETVDWAALEAEAADAGERARIRALKTLCDLARAHSVGPPPLVPPFSWGSLQVREHVASGAHGDVYCAYDPRLDRDVALKLLPQHADDGSEAHLTIAEGRRLARVRHPNVVTVYGADRIAGQAGLWMELVHGSTLHEILAQEGPLPPGDACAITAAVCDGLAAIHAAGLVHRDLKAQNVVRDREGRILVMDLGAGQDRDGSGDDLEGTPLYLAPELLAGGRATVASDIYAVGVLLFFLVAGRYPWTAPSIEDLRQLQSARGGDPEWPEELPPALRAVIARALMRDPAERFASGAAMKDALAASTRRGPSEGPAHRVTPLLVLVMLAVLGGLAWWTYASPGDVRRVVALPHYSVGEPSGDGRHFPYVDASGALKIWEVATGATRIVEHAGPEGGASRAVMAHDGSRIVYSWRYPDGAFELRTTNPDGQWRQVILSKAHSFEPVPLDWSTDGTRILCRLRYRDGTSDLAVAPVNGDPIQHLHRFTTDGLVRGRLSPDGRFAVVSIRESIGTGAPLTIVAADGSSSSRVLPVGNDYELPAWTPDGDFIVALRPSGDAASGARDMWLVPMDQGEAVGPPRLAERDVGGVLDLWVTTDGALYTTTSTYLSGIYSVPLDLSGERPTGTPSSLSPANLGQQVAPTWSPDGRLLAYIVREPARTPGLIENRSLWIKSLEAGVARRMPVQVKFLGGYMPAWRPDSRALAVWGRDTEAADGWGYFEVDVQTGDTRLLARLGTGGPTYPQYAPDGRALLYLHPDRGILSNSLEDGGEHVLIPRTHEISPGTFLLSPDGAGLAYAASVTAGAARWSEVRLATAGHPGRTVVRLEPPEGAVVHGWSPSGDLIVYGRVRGSRQSLWAVSPVTGATIDLRFEAPVTPNPFRLDPTATRLAYQERVGRVDLRIRVRFLPSRHLGAGPH